MTEPDTVSRRRRRPAVSCAPCRKRKIRCNRSLPCNHCSRSNPSQCVYESNPPLVDNEHSRETGSTQSLRALQPLPEFGSLSGTDTSPSTAFSYPGVRSTTTTTPVSEPSSLEIDTMRTKIQQLEEQLSRLTVPSSSTPAPTSSDTETSSTSLAGVIHFHRTGSQKSSPFLNRSVLHKTRMFGQSHWINGMALMRDVADTGEPYFRDSSAATGLQRCKTLARAIKARRSALAAEASSDLPPKALADELVDIYLRTTETLYRILHVQSFKNDYEALWLSETKDEGFLAQVRLVLAIGASIYDENFSMRQQAVKWLYDAHNYLSQPVFKSRYTIQHIQTSLLLLLAREYVGIGEEFIWTSAGSLLRTGIQMALHRDPQHLPKSTPLNAELRRRLWNTILEINIVSSHTAGGPPLISLDDFDTLPPGNFDDEQLLEDEPKAKPDNIFTQTSIAIALRKLLPVRLKITRLLNNLNSSGTYETVLQLDRELRGLYKEVRSRFKGFNTGSLASVSEYGIDQVDFTVHRYISSLHVPFFGTSFSNPTYAYSRNVLVDSSLQLWHLAYPSSYDGRSTGGSGLPVTNALQRLIVCGSGFRRTAIAQASMMIFLELKAQLEDNTGIGPSYPRPDLLAVIRETRSWNALCMQAGETNAKGMMVSHIFAAYIDGLMRGVDKEDLAKLLVTAVQESNERALEILESLAMRNEALPAASPSEPVASDTPSDIMNDFLMMPEMIFDPTDVDSMSWAFL